MLAPLLIAGLCLTGALGSAFEPTECTFPPEWKIKGSNPLLEARKDGNVTVVALLDGNCGYCLLQAKLLQRLKTKLEKKNIRDITYMIINKGSSSGMKFRFEKVVNFKVYQSESDDIWKLLKGGKDDFLIYDRCGRLAYYLHHSVTYLGWPYVKNAVLYTHQNKHRCKGQCPKENGALEKSK